MPFRLSLIRKKTLFEVLTQDLLDRLKEDKAARSGFIFLEPSEVYLHQWDVHAFDPAVLMRVRDVIGEYEMLSVWDYERFAERCAEEGLEIVFWEEPTPYFAWLESLDNLPEVSITSDREGTIQGFFPFQIPGFNMLKQVRGAIANWSTGTGKTVLGAALTIYHKQEDNFDICVWVVKAHNKINTQRALKTLVAQDAHVVDGDPEHRLEMYEKVKAMALFGEKPVMILNYEKFRDDKDELQELFDDYRLFIVWDEMPSKLKNRSAALYRSVCEVLYYSSAKVNGRTTFYPRSGKTRSLDLRQIMLSATPIENNPEDWFNVVRILDPDIYGSVNQFNAEYVAAVNNRHQVVRWKNLSLLGQAAAHITHQVDKSDPDIAKFFPDVMDEVVWVDLDPHDWSLYNRLLAEYQRAAILDTDDLLAIISVLQMLVDNPFMVVESATWRADFLIDGIDERGSDVALDFIKRVGKAEAFNDLGAGGRLRCAKLLALHDLLSGNNDKAVVFSTYNALGLPILSEWLTEWGIDHVCYNGAMSMSAKQAAQDRFTDDPDCRVFLSSDAGSDSINLEQATRVIHYNLPWKWSTLTQRQNRIHRITSKMVKVTYYTIAVAGTIEDRKRQILDQKYRFHTQVLKGAIADQAEALRNRSELLYILNGDAESD